MQNSSFSLFLLNRRQSQNEPGHQSRVQMPSTGEKGCHQVCQLQRLQSLPWLVPKLHPVFHFFSFLLSPRCVAKKNTKAIRSVKKWAKQAQRQMRRNFKTMKKDFRKFERKSNKRFEKMKAENENLADKVSWHPRFSNLLICSFDAGLRFHYRLSC